MTAGGTLRLPQAWRAGIADGLRGAGRDWLFAVKGTAAILTTAWLAMYFQLQLPASAMMTVAIVMHPQSGTVLAKAFYRAVGTLVGSLVGLLLIALFPQQHLLFLIAMAVWIGSCAAGASLYRNFKSYAFVLGGYTAAIVALPVMETPELAFTAATMRVSEVMLGLVVASVFSDVFFPQRLRDVLRQTLRKQFADFVDFVAGSVGSVLDSSTLEDLHLRIVREVVQIEGLRSSVVFEHEGLYLRNPRLKRLNHTFMVASTTYQSLHHLMNRLQGEARAPAREALLRLFEPVAAAFRASLAAESMQARARTLEQRMTALESGLAEAIRLGEASLQEHDARLDYVSGVELLTRFVREMREYAEAYAGLISPAADAVVPSHRFTHDSDLAGAGLAAVRAGGVIAAMGVFWYLTAATFGAWALLLAAIFSSLLAGAPNPFAAMRNMALGTTAGIVAAFVLQFMILPHMDGFTLWAASMLPFMLVGFYLYTRPSLPGIGTGFIVTVSLMLMQVDAMNFSAVDYFDSALSQFVGMMGALAGFIVFVGAYGSRWLQARLRRKLRLQVVRACREPLPDLLGRFESASRDVLIQIAGLTPPGSDASRRLLAFALSVQETGRALIELRQDIADAGERSMELSMRALDGVAALYASPDPARYRVALAAVVAAIDATPHDAPEMAHLHLIRLALLDAGSVPSAYLASGEAQSEELSYAA
ncbi:MAG: FUSC family protein [Acidihalobacter sp.]